MQLDFVQPRAARARVHGVVGRPEHSVLHPSRAARHARALRRVPARAFRRRVPDLARARAGARDRGVRSAEQTTRSGDRPAFCAPGSSAREHRARQSRRSHATCATRRNGDPERARGRRARAARPAAVDATRAAASTKQTDPVRRRARATDARGRSSGGSRCSTWRLDDRRRYVSAVPSSRRATSRDPGRGRLRRAVGPVDAPGAECPALSSPRRIGSSGRLELLPRRFFVGLRAATAFFFGGGVIGSLCSLM